MERVESIPPPKRRARIVPINVTALAVTNGDCVLLCERPAGGLWGGMLALPAGERNGTGLTAFAEAHLPRAIAVRAAALACIGQVEHQLTHRHVRFDVYHASIARIRLPLGFRWHPVAEAKVLPTAFRKILQLLRDHHTATLVPARRSRQNARE